MREFLIFVVSVICGAGAILWILMMLKKCFDDIFKDDSFF